MQDFKLTGEVEQSQIDAWKAEVAKKYGEGCKVLAYQVDEHICYLRTVDRATYSAAIAKVSTSPAKFTETIIENCWLGGSETIKNEEAYLFGLNDFIEDLIAKKKGSIKML